MGELLRSLQRIEHGLFHRNLFASDGSTPLVGLYTSTLRFSDRGQGDTTGIWSTVLDNPLGYSHFISVNYLWIAFVITFISCMTKVSHLINIAMEL